MHPASKILFSVLALMCMASLSGACGDSDDPSSKTAVISTVRVKMPTKALNNQDFHSRQVTFRDENSHIDWSLDLKAVAFRQLRRYGSLKRISPSDELPIYASLLLNATCSAPCEFVEARLVNLTHESIKSSDYAQFPYKHKDIIDSSTEFNAIVCSDCSMTIELDYRKIVEIDLTKTPHEERQTVLSDDFASK